MQLNRTDATDLYTRNDKYITDVHAERLTESARWVPSSVRTALAAYCKAHSDVLSEKNQDGFQYRNMFKFESVFDDVFGVNPEVDFKGVQGTLEEGCRAYHTHKDSGGPYFQFHVEKEYFVGKGIPLDCNPPRQPVILFHTTYRVKVNPSSPNCFDRWEIDKVFCGFAFSKWSMGWDLKATHSVDVV
tara:strand:- start:50 stop:610 length:561 start_codon:yes stop_codon:yes gene_type:complete